MPIKSNKRPSPARRVTAVRRAAGDTMVRIGATIGLPAALQSLGANTAQLLSEVGVDLSLFDSPDNLLSYSARGRLLEHCVARTGCEHLGLLVGQRGSLQSLGLVGSLVKYSPDVGTALRSLVRFFHHQTRGANATLTVDGQLAYFGYEVRQPGNPGTAQVVDGALAVMLNIMQSLCGPGWQPSQVTFAHRKPDDVEPFRRIFHAPLRFDAEQNALVFLADWLTYRLPADDPELRRQLTEHVKAIEAHHRELVRGTGAQRAAHGSADGPRRRRSHCVAVLDTPPNAEPPPEWGRHKLQGSGRRGTLWNCPAGAR